MPHQNMLINSKKIISIGNAGGGKSTLCRVISKKYNIPVYYIDHIQWNPGWVRVSDEEYASKHAKLMSHDKWIIDGFGPWEYVQKRFDEADTIIYIDLPLHIHYYWATKRQIKCIFNPRIDGPPGCPMLPVTFKLYKMMFKIHPFVERLIGTVRREYLDKLLFFTSTDLQHKLDQFKKYYNEQRGHSSRGMKTPVDRADRVVNINNYSWKQHCRGLFQLPVAA